MRSEVKILHLQTSLDFSCGITRYIETLSHRQNEEHQFVVFCTGGNKAEMLRIGGVIIEQHNLSPKWYSIPFVIYLIVKTIKKHKIDIVHSHHRFFDFAASSAAKILGIPSVMTVHSITEGRKGLSYKSDVLIAVSDSVKKHLVNVFGIPKKKIITLHNGADPSLYTMQTRESKSEKIFTLGFIGRLSAEKGIDILLTSLRELIQEKFTFKTLIAGTGEFEADVIRFQEEFPSVCQYKGNVSDISSIYSEIDILILPSRVDPFPFTILECGLFNIPVIASDVNGIAELMDDTISGRLIPPENVAALKQAILQAANSPEELKNWAGNLRKKVTSEYQIDKHVTCLFEIYNSMKRADGK